VNGSALLARNDVDILVLPAAARQAAYKGQLAVEAVSDPLMGITDTTQPLASTLGNLGYSVSRTLASGGVAVTANPTENELLFVREGGKMLYISSGVGPFFWWEGRGGVYSGNWMTSFSWLRPDVFRRLEVSNPLTLPYAAVMPKGVLKNLPVEDQNVQGDFLGGQITGWIGHAAIHTVQFRYGRGIVLMTTYSLIPALSGANPDPVAVAMLHDLVDHLASDACQPVLTNNL
jgi:hypothetical protein